MSDSAEAGSVQPDAAAAGNPAGAQTTPDNGSAGEAAKTWLDGLSEGNRKLAESKGWKEAGDADKLVTSYAELEKLQGQSLKLPAEDAPAEEWDKVLSKLPASMRAPESPDKYEFKLPEGLPPDLPYSEDLASKSKEWMHKAGLPPDKAQAVHDGFVGYMAEQYKAEAEANILAINQQAESTCEEIVKEWGPLTEPKFKETLDKSKQGLKKLGLWDPMKEVGFISDVSEDIQGLARNAQVLRAGLAAYEKFVEEDGLATGGVPEGQNPFKKDAKGHRNVTAISSLVKNDLPRATRLAKEAGENINEWVSRNPR